MGHRDHHHHDHDHHDHHRHDRHHHDPQEAYEQVNNAPHKAQLSHELIAAAASFAVSCLCDACQSPHLTSMISS
ncbi:hypothetical protein AZE42_13093 [Rhizopogon vesiculosus]|uniref:Uncharacterized protein n=1 Tax=Rhizopogon vesiculosus TaxID=180088 RepID=A0A1J8R599_9AGAM|nr:hypothetical protein AZE42_13093 [Rhizopogon vesiculosus]